MKKKFFIVLGLIMIILSISILLLYMKKLDNNKKEEIHKCEKLTKDKYYEKMIEKLEAYYTIYFNSNILLTDVDDKNISAPLRSLNGFGFIIDDFVSYDTKEPCDPLRTYAVRTKRDDKYIIKINYLCGNDSNFNYETSNKNTAN